MSEVKIKNITVSVDGQDFSFTAKSLVAEQQYDAAKDPEVQGKGIEEVQVEATPEAPAEPVAEPQVEAPVEAVATE